MRKKLMRSAIFALVVLASPAALAADVEYCKLYAQHAIEKARAGRQNPACAAHMVGARWSVSVRVHFDYCMTNPIDVVENLQGERNAYLHSCGAAQ